MFPSFFGWVGTWYQCEVPFFSCPINKMCVQYGKLYKREKKWWAQFSRCVYPDKYTQNNYIKIKNKSIFRNYKMDYVSKFRVI
jgi:hypothetical protein